MDSPQTTDAAAAPATDARALGVILLATLALFWPTLASFPGTWNVSYQEHGFFVAALVVWLLWRDRRRIVDRAGAGIPDLLPVLGLLSVAWLFAVVMNVRLVHQFLFTLIMTVAAFVVFGWSARRIILVTAATFLLAIPFWGSLMPSLQRVTVIASGGIATLAGIEAEIGYDYISISAGTFLVEQGCSGINYLMGGLVLGASYGHLFTDRWQTQLKIVTIAGGMAIVGNWIRVAVLIFLGEATAMQSPYIEDHLWQGWAIFVLLMIPTYFLARRIELRDAARASEGDRPPADAAPRSREVPLSELRRRATRAAAVACMGPILFLVVGAVPRGGDLDRDPGLFSFDSAWTMTEAGGDGAAVWRPDFKGVDDEVRWSVAGPEDTIHAARYYFTNQRQGEELIQYDNRVAPDSLVAADRVIGPVGPERRFVREAVIRDAETPRVVWYWYRVAGFDTPFDSKAKLLEVLAFFRRMPAAELVVIDAPCAPDDCANAAMAVRSAMGVPAASDVATPADDRAVASDGP